MALKDWKQIENHPRDNKWRKNKNTIGIWEFHHGGWFFERYDKELKYFKTKSQALKYAKAYMRKH